MQKILNKKIVMTGGGSGGHVSVSLALLSELESRYSNLNEKLLYIGGDLGMVGDSSGKSFEQKRFEGTKYNFKVIRAGKLQREISFNTLKLLFRSILGFFDSYKLLKGFKPDLIISTGGYVSVPVCLIGYLLKIPIYIHEQTAAVGLSNKISSMVAKKIFVTFKESERYFPKEKTITTGNPVRKEIFEISNSKTDLSLALDVMKDNNLPIIYVSGGGLGSHKINVCVRDSLIHLLEKYQVVLQTGENTFYNDYDVLTTEWKKLPEKLRNRLFVTKYINNEEIGKVFNYSVLFIGRSGANTVYELGVLKKQSILIPIPWVTHNEQEKNAKVLEKLGLAKILKEDTLTRDTLLNEISLVLDKENKIDEEELTKYFTTNASVTILNNIF